MRIDLSIHSIERRKEKKIQIEQNQSIVYTNKRTNRNQSIDNSIRKSLIILMEFISIKHFQRLITDPFLLLKIDAYKTFGKSQFVTNWKQMIEFYRHQIYSIRLDESSQGEEFLTSLFPLNSSFINHK